MHLRLCTSNTTIFRFQEVHQRTCQVVCFCLTKQNSNIRDTNFFLFLVGLQELKRDYTSDSFFNPHKLVQLVLLKVLQNLRDQIVQ